MTHRNDSWEWMATSKYKMDVDSDDCTNHHPTGIYLNRKGPALGGGGGGCGGGAVGILLLVVVVVVVYVWVW